MTKIPNILILYNPYYQKDVIEAHLAVLKERGKVAFLKLRSKLKDKFSNDTKSIDKLFTLLHEKSENLGLIKSKTESSIETNIESKTALDSITSNLAQNNAIQNDVTNAPHTPDKTARDSTNNATNAPNAINNTINNPKFLQLFLSDYANLYVAKVIEIDKTAPSELIPSYYKTLDLDVEAAFIIEDMRELVRNDFCAIRDKFLPNFKTPDFNGHTYALYGNSYTYPLHIEQKIETIYFEDGVRHFTSMFKNKDFIDMQQCLIDFVFGKKLFYVMHPNSLESIIYAELEYAKNQQNPLYDFTSIALKYAKAFEQECYLLIKHLIWILSKERAGILDISFEVNGQTRRLESLFTNNATLGV